MDKEKQIAAVIASNITHYLDVNRMSRRELAEKIGVSVASVGFWYTGAKIPRMDKVDRMCDIFNCERSDILMEPIALSSDDPSDLTPPERDHMRKYRAVDDDGRQLVDNMLDTMLVQKEKTDALASAS